MLLQRINNVRQLREGLEREERSRQLQVNSYGARTRWPGITVVSSCHASRPSSRTLVLMAWLLRWARGLH